MSGGSYESRELLHQYLLFHYGEAQEQLPWEFGPVSGLGFPVRCVQEGVETGRLPGTGRALDVGCAVGRATFELARLFNEVIGIDFSTSFVAAAQTIAQDGQCPYEIHETGTITTPAVARRPEGISGAISFEQGDAQDLRDDLGTFDCVLAANLLCRLGWPEVFLKRLGSLLNPGGQLILTTPNTWLETFTARKFWMGATPETGEPLEAIRRQLEADFELDAVWDMPFLIREHRRKYQWSVAQASRWIRKP